MSSEKEFNGSTGQFRNSEFIDAAEDLAGKTRLEPVEMTVELVVICDGVINNDGKEESGVLAVRLVGAKRKLRMNRTKMKAFAVALNSSKPATWKGAKVRIYQTLDSDRRTGGKTATTAVAVDIQKADGNWTRYLDFQQPKGKKHVKTAGLDAQGLA